MTKIMIGIPTFNGSHRVNYCLQSIEKWEEDLEDYKVDKLIVDDGSNEIKRSEMIWVSQHYNVPVLFHEENKGISRSWNELSSFGDYDIIILLNDDILVNQDWVKCVTFFIENNENIGAVGWNFYFIVDEDIPQILESEYPLEIKREPITKVELEDEVVNQKPSRIMAATGCCFAFTKEKFNLTGGFDEHYQSFYEETHFGTMLASKGFPSYMLPYPKLYHLWGKTFAENPDVLKPQIRMNESRRYYKDFWGGDTDYTNPKFMDPIEPQEIIWLDHNLEPQRDVIE